jgi:hypothetical protein
MRDVLILDLRGSSGAQAAATGTIPILWPAYAWRVCVPEPRDRVLNLFERAILAASRVGTFPADQLAASLHLHSELVRVILQDLRTRDLLDESGRPTAIGCAALEDEENVWEGATTGWVFQDPWNGRLHPHFARQLRFAEVENAHDGSELIKVDGQLATAFRLTAPENMSLPTTLSVLLALRAHKRREKARDHLDDEWLTGYTEDSSALPTDRVEFVSSAPWPVYLLTVGRVARDGVDPTLDDLFGLGEDPELWEQLRRLAFQHEDAVFRQCVEAVHRLAESDQGPGLSAHLMLLREKARDLVQGRLTTRIERYDAVCRHLIDMEQHLALSQNDDNPRSHWNPARVSARRSLEAVVKILEQGGSKNSNLINLLTDDPDDNRRLLNQYAHSLGFATPLPFEFTRPTKKEVSSAWSRGIVLNFQLGAVTTLLQATSMKEHRLRIIAAIDPHFFDLLRSVKNAGNQGAHDNESLTGGSEAEERQEIETMRTDCYRIVALILDLPLERPISTKKKDE